MNLQEKYKNAISELLEVYDFIEKKNDENFGTENEFNPQISDLFNLGLIPDNLLKEIVLHWYLNREPNVWQNGSEDLEEYLTN